MIAFPDFIQILGAMFRQKDVTLKEYALPPRMKRISFFAFRLCQYLSVRSIVCNCNKG